MSQPTAKRIHEAEPQKDGANTNSPILRRVRLEESNIPHLPQHCMKTDGLENIAEQALEQNEHEEFLRGDINSSGVILAFVMTTTNKAGIAYYHPDVQVSPVCM